MTLDEQIAELTRAGSVTLWELAPPPAVLLAAALALAGAFTRNPVFFGIALAGRGPRVCCPADCPARHSRRQRFARRRETAGRGRDLFPSMDGRRIKYSRVLPGADLHGRPAPVGNGIRDASALAAPGRRLPGPTGLYSRRGMAGRRSDAGRPAVSPIETPACRHRKSWLRDGPVC